MTTFGFSSASRHDLSESWTVGEVLGQQRFHDVREPRTRPLRSGCDVVLERPELTTGTRTQDDFARPVAMDLHLGHQADIPNLRICLRHRRRRVVFGFEVRCQFRHSRHR